MSTIEAKLMELLELSQSMQASLEVLKQLILNAPAVEPTATATE